MEEIHRGCFVCLCSSLCPLYILGRMNCCERRSLWAVGLTYRHEGKSSPDYCCCGMDSFSWSSQHEGHPSCLVSSSPFVLDWCVHVYVHPYLCLCVCVCMYVGIWCLSSVSLPTLEQCPAVLPISTLIWMLLGRKRKSGIAGSYRAVINLEMISTLPEAWCSNQCNMLELILLPSLLSCLVS